MADPFKHVTQGEPLNIAATAWNRILDVAREEATGAALGPGATRQAAIVKVKNETGASLDRANIVGLGDPIFTPYAYDDNASFLREVTFRGEVLVVDKHMRRFAITLEPIGDGIVGRAYVAGVCPVRLNVQDAYHEYATIAAANRTYLVSTRYGFAQILWTETDAYGYAYDTGVMWAIVRLGAHCPSFAIGKANGDISAMSGSTYGTGMVDIYQSLAGSENGPLDSVSVLNVDTLISDGKKVGVGWDLYGTAWVSPMECE